MGKKKEAKGKTKSSSIRAVESGSIKGQKSGSGSTGKKMSNARAGKSTAGKKTGGSAKSRNPNLKLVKNETEPTPQRNRKAAARDAREGASARIGPRMESKGSGRGDIPSKGSSSQTFGNKTPDSKVSKKKAVKKKASDRKDSGARNASEKKIPKKKTSGKGDLKKKPSEKEKDVSGKRISEEKISRKKVSSTGIGSVSEEMVDSKGSSDREPSVKPLAEDNRAQVSSDGQTSKRELSGEQRQDGKKAVKDASSPKSVSKKAPHKKASKQKSASRKVSKKKTFLGKAYMENTLSRESFLRQAFSGKASGNLTKGQESQESGRHRERIGFWEWFRQHKSLVVIWGMAFAVISAAAGAYYYVVTNYKVTTVYVDGNIHYTNEEIMDMVMKGPYGDNSLYLAVKYKDMGVEGVPFVEKMDVNILAPNMIRINVYEKALAGYVEYLGRYMYFDRDGIVVESSQEETAGIPLVTGLQFGYVVLNEKLPVENETIFKRILSITQLLDKYELMADRIYFDPDYNLTLYFKGVRVTLGGSEEIDEKVMRLQYILPELTGKSGVLSMENYSDDSKLIPFHQDEN